MESATPNVPADAPETPAPASSNRDPDLVALEGFEAEFSELEVELDRVDRRGGADDPTS
jgi:hypothetical protein